jgi:flagellar L-ring protein precursor FlgH
MKLSRLIRLTSAGLLMLACIGNACATSLYAEKNFQPLASDRRALHKGDLVTVMVVENSNATSSVNTTSGRNGSVGIDLERPSKSVVGSFGANNQLTGGGQTQRADTVVAQITVTVIDVAANGDLLVTGEQLLEVNNEHQHIKVEGRIRPVDVSATNTVLSTRIANAKISYVGAGDLSETQRAGWWQRALTWFGL